ncbi:MAG: bifunctional serine/threonine-protein kinase/ABC transporter substrate-binding protein [Candidatus Bruticola sp.]
MAENNFTEGRTPQQPEFTMASGPVSLPTSGFIKEIESSSSAPIEKGTVLQGRYKVVGLLGRGGFGAVYRVTDLRLPGKFWALKELHFPDKSQLAEAKRSFEREARLLSSLIHRSLPVIVDFFSEGESTFLLMEEIKGCNLAQLVEENGQPSEVEALRWGLEIARVLEYLHSQQPPIIFRDLKPENVMISSDGHVKLIDFGLARFFDPTKKRDTSAVGSVGYAPPEVWEDSSQTDARSDIYSFGATLYFVLTGKPPSPVYGRHQLSPYCPNINPNFAKLVLRCMQVNPDERCQNMGQVIKELISILSVVAADDPILKDELRAESFCRVAAQSINRPRHVVIANASSRSSSVACVPRAASTSKLASVLIIICSLLFVWGAWGGLQSVLDGQSWEFDIPYELVNPDKETARLYINQQNWPKAMVCLVQAVTRHPSDAEAHIMKENVNVYLSGKKYFRLPAFMTLSGVNAPEAYRLLYGIAMAQNDFNRSGGAKDGRLAVIDIYDDRSSMETAAGICSSINGDQEYLGVIGPFSSQFSLALSPLFNAAQLPILTPVVSAPGIWEQGPCIFTASDTNAARCRVIADYLFKKGYRRVGIVIDRDSVLSANVAEYFRNSFKKAGGKIGSEADFSNVKFDRVIDKFVQDKVDCVFFSDHRGTPLALFAEELRSRGITIPIASQVAPFTKDLLSVGGSSVDGLILSGYFHCDSPDPATKRYTERFRRLFGGISPSHLDASAFDAANIMLSAYKNGVKTRQEMRAYLHSIGADPKEPKARPCWKGATGTFSLARQLDIRDIYLIEIRKGKYELIKLYHRGVKEDQGMMAGQN